MNNVGRIFTQVFLLFVLGVAAIYPFLDKGTPTQEQPKPVVKKNKSVKKYSNEFLPDFSAIRDVKKKKTEFFGYLKPLVEQVNEEVSANRAFIKSLDALPTEGEELARLNKLLKRYDIEVEGDFVEMKKVLLRRVDTLPVALVLMQAANESAWGTSRFALQANNLFGQWCFSPGCGVVPKGRPQGETYEVRKFDHPIDSIRSYFNNLNTGHAYKDLRVIRQELRNEGVQPSATELAEGLTKYSIRREEYVVEIQNMIRVNKKYL